jgi:sugar lactone lactonase YvrE
MTYPFGRFLPTHIEARLRRPFLFRLPVVRLSLLAKGMAWSLLFCSGPLWAAFTIIFNGVVSIVNTGSVVLSSPADVIADSSGNLYISDRSNSRIIKVAAGGSASPLTITGLSPALSSPVGMALDGAGNLYIADSGNARIVKVIPSGNGSVINTPSITLSSPNGVAVDAQGNVFIADTGNNRIVQVTAGGVASVLGITGLGTPLNTPLGLTVDATGNLYIADSVNSRVVKVAAGGTAGTVLNVSGVTLTTPAGLSLDSFGNLYVADTTNTQIVVVTISNGAASLIGTGTVTLNQPQGVAVDPAGIVYIADTSNNRAISVATSSVGYGHSSFGTSSGKVLTLPFTVGIIATVGNVKVFTAGTENLDFTLQGTNSCTPGTTGNVACSVDVQFLPTAPGLRRGAIVVYDNGSPAVPLIIVPLFGTGDASQAAITPGSATVVSTGNVLTSLPFQLALDGAGNIYSANYTGSNVVKIPAGGGSASVVPIATLSPALSFLTGMAIDGAGDLFFGDHINSRIVIVSAGGYTSTLTISGLSTGLSEPTGIFFDGAGNLYISDWQNDRVVKVTRLLVAQNSSRAPSTGAGSVVTPGSYTFTSGGLTGVAVDPQGTVYFADRTGNRVIKVTSTGTASVLTTTGLMLNNPQGVSADGMGNIYIADSGNNRIVQVTTAGVTSVLKFTGSAGSLSGPFGVTVDPLGNLLIPDWSNNRIVKVNVSGATLAFPNTNVNATSAAQTATVTNLGNDALVFSANPTYTANFSNNSADTNPCTSATSLTAGNVCDVAVNFTPQASGSQSSNITLTNNTLNVPNSTQLVSVSGAGISVGDATSTTVSVNPASAANGQPVTLTATVADTISGHAANHPTGTVSFSDLVGSTAVSLGTATLSSGVGTKSGVQLSTIGTHTITASYAGVSGTFLASSGTASVALGKAAVTVTGPATQPVPVINGQAGSAVITVSGPYTTIAAPTGTITYSVLNASGVSVASGTLPLLGGSGSATATVPIVSTLASGSYTISVTYSGDGNYMASSVPGTVLVTVGLVPTTVSLTSSSNPNPVGSAIIFTASVSGAGGTPTGSVSFSDGTTLLATVALSAGVAAYSTSSLAAGVHSIAAMYAGDNSFASSSSTAVTQTVQDFTLTIAPTSPGGGNPTQTVVPGGTATYALAVGPASGQVFPAAISLGVSGLPAGATATITPQVLPAGSGLTDVTLTIVLPKQAAAFGSGEHWSRRAAPMLLGILLLPFAMRRWRWGAAGSGRMVCALFMTLASCGLVTGLSGCGSTSSGYFGQAQQSYSVVITATSGSISHATTVVLVVQ